MDIVRFITESNHIEGIDREPTPAEVETTAGFVLGDKPTIESLCILALVYTPKALLRESEGMDVRVGQHRPPKGGTQIKGSLAQLLESIDILSPYEFHLEYETLHPFMDGNGRTGRALWLWQMLNLGEQPFDLGFLHWWYYQSLQGTR